MALETVPVGSPYNNVDFPSRVSARGIFVGAFTAYSSFLVFLTVIAAIGLWNFNAADLRGVGPAFGVITGIAWLISVGLGAYTSALIGRSYSALDGRLHGIGTWAISSVFGFLVLALGTGIFFNTNPVTGADVGGAVQIGRGLMWLAFITHLLGLVVAVLSGAAVARRGGEVIGERREERRGPRAA